MLELPSDICDVDGDAFMNCTKLYMLVLLSLIHIYGIEQITVSTQTTGQKQDVIIEKEKYEDLISKL